MARGSGTSGSKPTSGAGLGMLGSGGTVDNTGKLLLKKKYFLGGISSDTSSDLLKAPDLAGFDPMSIGFNAIGSGVYEQEVTYQKTITSNDAPNVYNFQGDTGVFELQTSDEQYPIETHYKIKTLIDNYGGRVENGKVIFPEKYTPVNGGGLGGGASVKNPMFGVRYYSAPSATFRHTFQSNTIPGNIWTNCGKMITGLPAGFPTPAAFAGDAGVTLPFFWIVLSPSIKRSGNNYEITRNYKLSRAGELSDIYLLTQIQAQQ